MRYYTIDELIELFEKHAKESREIERARCEKQECVYIENFNICDALHSICKAIIDLREEKPKLISGWEGHARCITSDGRNVNIADELNRLESQKRLRKNHH
jgi:hypothetical protein